MYTMECCAAPMWFIAMWIEGDNMPNEVSQKDMGRNIMNSLIHWT